MIGISVRGHAKLLFALLMVVSGFLIFDNNNDSAYACSCISFEPAEQMKFATAIFAGEVIEKKGLENDDGQITFKAEQAWKGVTEAQVTITNRFMGMCGGQYFEVGKSYLVYAHGELENLGVNGCSRTVEIEQAQADIDFLGPSYVPVSRASDLVIVDNNIGPLPAIFGLGAAVAGVIAFLTLRRKS